MSSRREQRAYSRLETPMEFVQRANAEETARAKELLEKYLKENNYSKATHLMFDRGPFPTMAFAEAAGYAPRLVWCDA